MKKLKLLLLLILTLITLLVSCSHQKQVERTVATETKPSCLDSVKGEYHNYFDSVQKCIEKEYDK